MANSLNITHGIMQGENILVHQMLHGYHDGHRLLKSSIDIPDSLTRLILQLSDLSGSNICRGFEEYITGYPLVSLDAYALAKTWYAPEMPRPGCVWTHTLVIPSAAMAQLRHLDSLQVLFKRPANNVTRGSYSEPIVLKNEPESELDQPLPPELLCTLLSFHYGKERTPVLLAAKNSKEFEAVIFAIWSQKWPSLRMDLTFCTGALSARTFDKRPFDLQCVPTSRVREVLLDASTAGEPGLVVANSTSVDIQSWAIAAATDASTDRGSRLRNFLWAVSNSSSGRMDFAPFITVFEATDQPIAISNLVELVAELFPEMHSGYRLKCLLFGANREIGFLPNRDEEDTLLALATTSNYLSFDGEALETKKRLEEICRTPSAASTLAINLFRSALNPLGEKILTDLASAIDLEIARKIAGAEPQVLPALLHANPSLAVSADLWRAGSTLKRELFDAVDSHNNLESTLVRGITRALLESDFDQLLRRALNRWGEDAVFQTLDWTVEQNGRMSDALRDALKSHIPAVMNWIKGRAITSLESIVAISHIVAPYVSEVSRHDTAVWLHGLHYLQRDGRESEANYIGTFLLALAFSNAPPSPLNLISESFEQVHDAARRNNLADSAWIIIEPFVPELNWFSNWDKCERLRRGLISAFLRHRWPLSELRRRIKDRELLQQLFKSAKSVSGGKRLLRAEQSQEQQEMGGKAGTF